QMMIDSVPAMIYYIDIENRVVRTNKELADLLKMSIKRLIGQKIEDLFSKEQVERMKKDSQEIIFTGKAKKNIIELYDLSKGTKWVITDKIPYKDKEGKVIGIVCLSKDITAQKQSEQKLQQSYQELKKTMDKTISTISKIIEAKDPYTAGHQRRVSQLAVAMAKKLKYSQDKIEGVKIASLIHDIGKIGLPFEILSKPGKLEDEEFKLIERHSQIGYSILKTINFSYPVAQIVLQHHERLNGSGYPNHLRGDEILPEAKILGVADVVEAMSSHRPYRPSLGINLALKEINQNKGILYGPEEVDACLRLFKEKGFKFE
ncbi:MAG: HD domain-containing protein, partial [Candidatus Atribacteria bacterium]|nr:HD domain-containing protein [Candidatus Atribacteria bacterium]